MPSNLLNADTAFPRFDERQSDSEKIDAIMNYLYMLLEQLRYSMENFNDTEIENFANLITKPIYVQLKDSEDNFLWLSAQTDSLQTRIENAEGDILQVTATAGALNTEISALDGRVATLSETVDSIRLSVTNGESSSTIQLFADGALISSQRISFSGMVTITDLETSGRTVINGNNIKTGTISAISIDACDITGSTITGSVFHAKLYNGEDISQGEIQFNFIQNEKELTAGGIRLEDTGEESTEYENSRRLYIYTDYDFSLKLFSNDNMSIETNSRMYLSSRASMSLTADGNMTLNLTKTHFEDGDACTLIINISPQYYYQFDTMGIWYHSPSGDQWVFQA